MAITGANGLLGNNLARALLADGREVRALVRENRRALEGLALEPVPGDVLRPDSLARAFDGVEVVYHAAARISLRVEDPLARETNVEGTRHVVEACLKAGVRRLVHFSSIHACLHLPLDQPIDESRPLALDAHLEYDRSKAEAEGVVRAGLERGLDAVILVPTAMLGAFDFEPSRMGRLLLDVCRRRMPGTVAGRFNWVDVADVVRSALAAEARGRRGERYLLGGHLVPIAELARLAAEAHGVPAPRFVSPAWLAKLGAPFAAAWGALSGNEPLFNAASVDVLQRHHLVGSEKAARELGHAPRPTAETVAALVGWFRGQGLLEEPRRPTGAADV